MELSHNLSGNMPGREMYFPTEIVENILSRLPSASIARFQAVSKHWCTIIRSFVLNARSKSSLRGIQLSTLIDSGELQRFNFDDEGKMIKSIHKLNVGSIANCDLSNMVNGLACVYGDRTTTNFYLVNLTTFETSEFSKRKIDNITIYNDQIALGFDPSSGSYKFIRIYSDREPSSFYCEILEIGNLLISEWKIIGEIPHKFEFDRPVFVNGAIYWMMISLLPLPSNTGKPIIFDLVKLDMKEEKPEHVASALESEDSPCKYKFYAYRCSFGLSEENGKLYMLHYCSKTKYLYGWRLKENNGGCIWNIAFHVNLESVAGKEPGCLLRSGRYSYMVGIVDGNVLIRNDLFNCGLYIYIIYFIRNLANIGISRTVATLAIPWERGKCFFH